MQFSLDNFDRIQDAVTAAGYPFLRFDDPAARRAEPCFLLRHDVDMSPENALELGTWTARRGLAANFFFQLNAETYNAFGEGTLEVIRVLRRRGHCVGLHIDQPLIGDDEAGIARTIEWFDGCITGIDRAISFHRPARGVLGRAYAGFVSAYDPDFFGADTYLSDSRRSDAFWPRLVSWLEEGRPRIQLLLHPEWWGPPSAAAVWERLRERRAAELRAYMRRSFPRVFADVIAE